jgi:hypothetical protein
LAATALVLGLTLAACGGSTVGSTTAPTPATKPVATIAGVTEAPIASHGTTAGADQCPTAATVGAALGVTLPKPTTIPGGGTTLPAGASGVSCEYAGNTYNVLIELITNIPPTDISLFSSKFPVPYASVSGVGDQARSFMQSLNGGKDNEGVVATKGSTLVSIVATATPASLAQIEALVSQLL